MKLRKVKEISLTAGVHGPPRRTLPLPPYNINPCDPARIHYVQLGSAIWGADDCALLVRKMN